MSSPHKCVAREERMCSARFRGGIAAPGTGSSPRVSQNHRKRGKPERKPPLDPGQVPGDPVCRAPSYIAPGWGERKITIGWGFLPRATTILLSRGFRCSGTARLQGKRAARGRIKAKYPVHAGRRAGGFGRAEGRPVGCATVQGLCLTDMAADKQVLCLLLVVVRVSPCRRRGPALPSPRGLVYFV